MLTRVGKSEIVEFCAERIRSGALVAFPTETVYGLGANARDPEAARRIFAVKRRPQDNPLIVHLADVSDVPSVACLSPAALKLFEAFSPGPLTVVMPKRPDVPDSVTAGLDTVAVRIPAHPLALEFLRACGVPVAAPSANLSGRVSPTTAERALEDLDGLIPAILDGGPCRVGIESTVVSLVGPPVILRPGFVTESMLRPYLPDIRSLSPSSPSSARPESPGMKYAHYRPSVPCALFENASRMASEYFSKLASGIRPCALAMSRAASELRSMGVVAYGLGADVAEFARNMFESMRRCEKLYDFLFIQAFGSEGLEGSVMNRLLKSSAGVVIR